MLQWKSFVDPLKYEDITPNLINRFKLHKSKTCTSGGINTYIKAIRSVYNKAIYRGVYTPDSYLSPFKGVMEKKQLTKDKYLTIEEMRKLQENEVEHRFYKLFMLCFYLGGIDYVDIINLKKSNIKNGRIRYTRFKGGTSEVIDNIILPEAEEYLKFFDNDSEYLTPFFKYVYKPYRQKYINWIQKHCKSIGIESYVSSKSPRYTFIDIGKNLLLNREVIKEITGHSNGDTHSIYEGRFPYAIKNEVHQQIVDSIKKHPH